MSFLSEYSQSSVPSFVGWLSSHGLSTFMSKIIGITLIALIVLLAAYIICYWILSGINHEPPDKDSL